MYKNKCITCGVPYKQLTRHQHHCIQCLHNRGPDLIVNQGDFHAEVYTELMPYKKLHKLVNSICKKKGK